MAYSSIAKPTDYFNTKLYTGNSSTQAITGVGFQPDWVWIKDRSETSSHEIFDAVRGVTKTINSNTTNEEATQADTLTAFGTDGFTLGSNGDVNYSGSNLVAWNWLGANGTASNSDGSITSTVSANTTAGFSIVSYTGTQSAATIGHGLGAVPGMLIIKNRSSTDDRDWVVYHKNLSGNNKYLSLNSSSAELTDAATFNNTAPTSAVFSSASSVEVNESSKTFIAYCFTEIKGYSKFGSYTGNGNADGTFVHTGFKPAFIITKSATSAEHWYMNDSKRSLNGADKKLFPNLNSAESSEVNSDLLSNGFKLRANNAIHNSSGQTYVFMAFAENPFVGNDSGTAVPVTAR